mgnify:CR=1 FL=1
MPWIDLITRYRQLHFYQQLIFNHLQAWWVQFGMNGFHGIQIVYHITTYSRCYKWCLQWESVESIVSKVESVFSSLKFLNPKAKLIFSSILPRKSEKVVNNIISSVNKELQYVCRKCIESVSGIQFNNTDKSEIIVIDDSSSNPVIKGFYNGRSTGRRNNNTYSHQNRNTMYRQSWGKRQNRNWSNR